MPCRIPPSAWLRAPIGLTTRPMSCTATIRSTRASPVCVSTATVAIWQPKVFTLMPSGLGERDRAAGGRPVPGAGRVAGQHQHLLRRDPEPLGGDHRAGRGDAGAEILH